MSVSLDRGGGAQVGVEREAIDDRRDTLGQLRPGVLEAGLQHPGDDLADFVEVVALQTGPRRIDFSVRDTGRGIPPQSMATLFEPFRRRQKPGEYAFSGSGLGLSICRKLVEAMGSDLQVETQQGQGTRFHFELDLPLASESPPG